MEFRSRDTSDYFSTEALYNLSMNIFSQNYEGYDNSESNLNRSETPSAESLCSGRSRSSSILRSLRGKRYFKFRKLCRRVNRFLTGRKAVRSCSLPLCYHKRISKSKNVCKRIKKLLKESYRRGWNRGYSTHQTYFELQTAPKSHHLMPQSALPSHVTCHKLPVFDHVDPLNPLSKLPNDHPILDKLRQPALDADDTVKVFHALGQCMSIVGYDKPPRPERLRVLQEFVNRSIASAAGVEPSETAACLTQSNQKSGEQRRKRRRETSNRAQPDTDSNLESLINAYQWQIPQEAQYYSPLPPPYQLFYRIQSSTFSHSTNSLFVAPIANNKPQSINPFHLTDYQSQIYGSCESKLE